MKLCQSSRVPDIAGGSSVLKVLRAWKCDIDWMDGTLMYEDWFVDAAIRQLNNVKKDILKSATEGSSFFGALTIILEIGLSNETQKILDLVEEATSFFLSALSPDDKNNGKTKNYFVGFQICGYFSGRTEFFLFFQNTLRRSRT